MTCRKCSGLISSVYELASADMVGGMSSLSGPSILGPISLTIFSPFSVKGMSETPVCLPFRLHSVSPLDVSRLPYDFDSMLTMSDEIDSGHTLLDHLCKRVKV